MRRSGFGITVTTVDQASAGLDKINRSLARMSAPAEQFNKQVQRFGDVSGVTRLTDGIGRLSSGLLDGFRSADRLAGMLGVISGATSIAGIVALGNKWQETGFQINLAARNLGIGVAQLTELQGAARLAGLSADEMTAGLRGLGETLRDATFGRNSDAIQMFQQLGVEFQSGPGKVRPMLEVLPELADKIAAIKDPFTQARVATALFGGAGEALLPLLRQGRAGIAALSDEARRFGNMSDASAASATSLHLALERMKLAGEGLANAIAEPLAPAVTDIAARTAEWTKQNRDWIATDMVRGIKETATEVDALAKQLGGWKEVGEDLLLWWGAKFLPGIAGGAVRLAILLKTVKSYFELGPKGEETLDAYQQRREREFGDWMERNLGIRPGILDRWFAPSGAQAPATLPPTSQETQARIQTAREYFLARGWTPAQVAGLLGNIQGESGFNPAAFNPAGGGQGAQGIGQWRGPRIDRFRAMYGKDPRHATLEEQLQYMDWELRNTESRAGAVLGRARTPDEAARAVTLTYSRPEALLADELATQRGGYARAFAAQAQAGPPQPPAVVASPAAPGTQGRVEVDVNLRGAPPGTTATATATGIAVAPPPRVAQTLPFGAP